MQGRFCKGLRASYRSGVNFRKNKSAGSAVARSKYVTLKGALAVIMPSMDGANVSNEAYRSTCEDLLTSERSSTQMAIKTLPVERRALR